MATADFELSMTLYGTPEELHSLLTVYKDYTNGSNGVKFVTISAKRVTEDTIVVCAIGPYGHYSKLNDVDIFRDMAEVAPNATFKAEITGNTTYTQQSLSCELSGGILHINTYFESNDFPADAYVEYFMEKLPHKKFVKMFKLDEDDFDDAVYWGFITDALTYTDTNIADMEYDEIMDSIEEESELDEDDYENVRKKLRALKIEGFEDFCRGKDFGERQELKYDPIAKAYMGNDSPVTKSNTPYDATDMMRNYLKENGLPYDDNAIASLSVEDAYAIMAGTYGKDADSIDDEDSEDDDFEDEDE